ncbi:cation:proton antiporter [Pelagicoccus sp. SDUM812002]|uniref:cation:proton antiporter n=1 Tax=Pelagicoccus sp. SDUM812002 TaxID=3041266 RepID=UPI00280C65A6|nr:cation:proton antiporter [Pelagicoccus sp. SDUM812002]MDQ8186578.1 cation:proton antiporter [Pelagicoccus sp. SDUM812002]
MELSNQLPIYLIQDFAVVLVSAAIASWVCRKIGLSSIVGYLLAGIIVGTPQITFPYVTDTLRIQLLSQVGLVFIMFSIGMGFRLQRFKQLGIGVLIATFSTAMLVLSLTRFIGGRLGFSAAESLFLAAMLMVSSSAVIGKTLQENGLTHRRFGQLALGMTLCEDMVAIVLLAFLGAYTSLDPAASGDWTSMLGKVGMLLGFASLILIPGLVLVPRLLRHLSKGGENNRELESLVALGLLFSMAFLTLWAGYSLALGAFLCGMIIAETPKVRLFNESFSGLRDMFVAVFFVAIGMAVDITQLPSALGLIALGVALALVLRWTAATFSLLLVAEDPEDALKAGMSLTPVGEFSFVIAGIGIAAGAIGENFQIAAVGISFATTILSPLILSKRENIIRFLPLHKLPILPAYQRLWQKVGQRQDKSLLWRIVGPRLWQIGGWLVFVTALLVFSEPLHDFLSQDKPHWKNHYSWIYWSATALFVLAPALALFRNVNAIASIVGESVSHGLRNRKAFRQTVIVLMRGLGLSGLALWIANFLPISLDTPVLLAAAGITVCIALFFGWRLIVRLQSDAEFAIHSAVNQETPLERGARTLQQAGSDWGVRLEDWVLGDSAQAGKSIGELGLRKRCGATIVSIERHGYYLPTVGPNTHLFPGDHIFATGSREELQSLRKILSESPDDDSDAIDFNDAILSSLTLEPGSPTIGATLRTLKWPRLIGVQVVAFRRGEQPPSPPNPDETLQVGDQLLLVGTANSLADAQTQAAPQAS